MTPSTPIIELTVEDLMMLIQQAVHQAMNAQKLESVAPISDDEPRNQWGILDIPPLSVGPWPDGLELISREEYYGDDGR